MKIFIKYFLFWFLIIQNNYKSLHIIFPTLGSVTILADKGRTGIQCGWDWRVEDIAKGR